MSQELDHLERIADNSLYAAGANSATIIHSFNVFSRFRQTGSLLELGPAEGVMTDLLAPLFEDYTAVDGSSKFCKDINMRHPHIKTVHSLFEDYEPGRTFDNVVLGHVLEHVQSPVPLLATVREMLSDDGIIFAAVPNSRSLHRQAAVIMGMLEFEEELNEADRHHGHRRVYNPETFRRDFLSAGLKIRQFGGYWMKPLSNRQIEESWSPELLDAFMQLGERYPDISGEIYVVATK